MQPGRRWGLQHTLATHEYQPYDGAMISVDEALQQVLGMAQPSPSQRVPLREAMGRVLAEDIASDIDSPPHDKSLVDGYAVSAAAFVRRAEHQQVELAVIEEVMAGDVPRCQLGSGTAIRVMTGAPIPDGAERSISRCGKASATSYWTLPDISNIGM